MSGSGGYYKYRCKYWLTYNCPHWVWVNNAPCAHCLADGRDSDAAMIPQFRISREIYVPQLANGALHYIMMEIVAASDADSGWAVKVAPTPAFPTSTVPTSVPSVVSLKSMSNLDVPEISKGGLHSGQSLGGGDNL